MASTAPSALREKAIRGDWRPSSGAVNVSYW